MTDERTLIDAMAEAICDAGRGHVSYWLTAPPEDRAMYRKEARAALRALLDHGPTPAMVEAGYLAERWGVVAADRKEDAQ